MALSHCISSDVILINVNHAGFTVCLFYGAVGRVELGPSTRSPAGSVGRWNGRGGGGFGGCWPWCAPLRSMQLNRGCVVGLEQTQTLPAYWKLVDEVVSFDKMTRDVSQFIIFFFHLVFWDETVVYCLRLCITIWSKLAFVAHCQSQFCEISLLLLSTVSSCWHLSWPKCSATLPPCWIFVLQCHNNSSFFVFSFPQLLLHSFKKQIFCSTERF